MQSQKGTFFVFIFLVFLITFVFSKEGYAQGVPPPEKIPCLLSHLIPIEGLPLVRVPVLHYCPGENVCKLRPFNCSTPFPTPTPTPRIIPLPTTVNIPIPTRIPVPTSILKPTPTSQPTPTSFVSTTPIPTHIPTITPTPTPSPSPSTDTTTSRSSTTGRSTTASPSPTLTPIPTPTSTPIPTQVPVQGQYRVSFDPDFNTLINTEDGGIFGSNPEKTIPITLTEGLGRKYVYIQFFENGEWVPTIPTTVSINYTGP